MKHIAQKLEQDTRGHVQEALYKPNSKPSVIRQGKGFHKKYNNSDFAMLNSLSFRYQFWHYRFSCLATIHLSGQTDTRLKGNSKLEYLCYEFVVWYACTSVIFLKLPDILAKKTTDQPIMCTCASTEYCVKPST
jgi:hypothetical protein